VTLKGRFAYGLEPPPEYALAPMAEVQFTIFLRGYEKANKFLINSKHGTLIYVLVHFQTKASWELSDDEKLEQAQHFKERGTDFLNQGKFNVALNKVDANIYFQNYSSCHFSTMPSLCSWSSPSQPNQRTRAGRRLRRISSKCSSPLW